MSGFMSLDVFLDLAHEHAVVFLEADGRGLDNEGFGELAGCVIGDGDDGRVGDRGVR